MRKTCAACVTMMIISSLFLIISIPSSGLRYSVDADIGNVDASFYWGTSGGARFGFDVALLGDINGDGIDDMILSATTSNGISHIVFGKTTGWSMDTEIHTIANASFYGDKFDARAINLANIGDVNRDGYDDFIIGAGRWDEYNGDFNVGRTYLIYGNSTGWSLMVELDEADASFQGEKENEYSGQSVDGAGDLNGDGYDDFLIGARFHDVGMRTETGKSYVVFGKGTKYSDNIELSGADASFLGEGKEDRSGTVAGIGDVNGDGFDDIAISGEYNDGAGADSGQVYIIFGKASGWSANVHLSNANASFIGEHVGDRAGHSIAGAGDVNGDGYDDILIGAYYNDEAFLTAGQVYLIFGKASGWEMDVNLTNANASFLGEAYADKVGTAVAGAGDVNGDGFDDFVISATEKDSGKVYMFLGKETGWSTDTQLTNVDASFIGESGRTGNAMSLGGDINRDGFDDVLVGAFENTEHVGSNTGQVYLIHPELNVFPTTISSVKVFSDEGFTNEISKASINDTIFVELQGTDNDPVMNNIAIVEITSNISSTIGLELRLRETGPNTGVFQGNFSIKERTHDRYRWVNATNGETVTVKSIRDESKMAEIIMGTLELFPSADQLFTNEDELYEVHYYLEDWSNTVWTFNTNASWLQWDDTENDLSGTPDNSDVGNYWVKINVSVYSMFFDEHYFILTVNNTPPLINTSNVEGATEDVEYNVDYDSTDDDQGITTWYLDTDADDWLSINTSTGLLNGTPINDHIGLYYVNVSVDDGNDGGNSTNFTLTVQNTNDPPVITTEDNESVYEDSEYSVQYEANEIDQDDVLTWEIATDAGDWLSIGPSTGLLSGTPVNEDVGEYWVNVTVEDTAHAIDHHNFSLTIINTNDQPEIISIPEIETIALFKYSYQVNATDVDVGDVLTYSLTTKPDGMTIDGENGLVEWTPTEAQEGQNQVIVSVSDGNASTTQDLNINVIVLETYPPRVTLLSPQNGSVVNVTNPKLTWSVEDPDSDTVYFDVYLSDDRLKVEMTDGTSKIAEGITANLFIPSASLQRGTTYFWIVMPTDGENIGTCTNGIWSFKIGDNATINLEPTVVLKAPINEKDIEQLPVQLEWSGADPDSEIIYYDVYLGTDELLVNGLDPSFRVSDDQTETSYLAEGLSKGMTYFWTVIPSDGENVGECQSGIWWFKIDETTVENHAPVISSSPIKIAVVGEQYQYDVEATDDDASDVLSYGLLERPDNMVIDAQTGLIIWTPNAIQVGNHTIKVKVSDGKLFALQTFVVTVTSEPIINNLPVITQIPDRTIKAGDDFIYQVAASDLDVDGLTYTLDGQPAGMDITSTGLISWTPSKDQVGEHTITVNVSDGKDHAIAHFKITVEKKGTTPVDGGLDATMLAIVAAIIIAVVVALLAVVATRGRKKEVEEVEEEEEPEEEPLEEPPEPPKEAPVEEEAEPEIPEEKPEAELEDEIDLDDLEDED